MSFLFDEDLDGEEEPAVTRRRGIYGRGERSRGGHASAEADRTPRPHGERVVVVGAASQEREG